MPINLRNPLLLRTLLLLFAVLPITLAAACSSTGDGVGDDSPVSGRVISVEPRSITEIETLVIVDSNGTEWEFVGGLFAGFTPSHLLEHMALGESVKVWYSTDTGSLKIVRIEDG